MAKGSATWKRVKFGEVVRLVKETCKDPAAAGIERVIGLEHIEPGDLRVRSWNDVADGTTFTTRARAGQVLFGKRRAYQRKVAVADFDAVCSGDIYVFESADSERLLPELLPFICQTEAFFAHAVGTSAGSLSPRTNWSSLTQYELSLPPLQVQARLAGLLRCAESVRRSFEESCQAARALRASFDEDFFRTAPAAWPRHPVSDLCEFFSRRHEASDRDHECDAGHSGAVPVLRSLNVWPGWFDLADLRYLTPAGNAAQSKLQLRGGDLLIVRTGDAGRPGNAAVVPDSMQGWNCLDLILARPARAVRAGYLEAALNRRSSLQRLTSLAPGTKQKHLTMTELHRLIVPLPPVLTQDAFLETRARLKAAEDCLLARLSAAMSNQKQLLSNAGGLSVY